MKLERYELKAEKSLMVFEFVSEGPKGEFLNWYNSERLI